MSDKLIAFPVTQNGSGDGVFVDSREENQAEGDAKSHAILPCKKPDNTLQYIPLNAAGTGVVVDTQSDTVANLSDYAKTVMTGSFVTMFDIALQDNTQYRNLEWNVANFRACEFEIVWISDASGTPVEDILAYVLVGPGDYTDFGKLGLNFTTLSTGDEVLRVRAKTTGQASDARATVTIDEVQ